MKDTVTCNGKQRITVSTNLNILRPKCQALEFKVSDQQSAKISTCRHGTGVVIDQDKFTCIGHTKKQVSVEVSISKPRDSPIKWTIKAQERHRGSIESKDAVVRSRNTAIDIGCLARASQTVSDSHISNDHLTRICVAIDQVNNSTGCRIGVIIKIDIDDAGSRIGINRRIRNIPFDNVDRKVPISAWNFRLNIDNSKIGSGIHERNWHHKACKRDTGWLYVTNNNIAVIKLGVSLGHCRGQ